MSAMDIIKPDAPHRFWTPRGRLVIAGFAVVTLVAAGVLFGMGKAAPTANRSDLWIEAATRGDMRREIRASGTLVPRDIRWITAGVTATVQQVVVLAGARVKGDGVILELTNPEVLANVRKAQAALAGAQADVAAARASLQSQLLDHKAALAAAESDLKVARIKNEANARAYSAGAIASVELRESQITMEKGDTRASIEGQRVSAFEQNMVAQLQASQSHRDEAASALAIAQQQADALQVRAGIDGILQQVEVEAGQQVQAGTKLARVARPDDLIARLQVPESLAGDLGLDQQVAIDVREQHVLGHVVRIDPAVREGAVTVDVALDQALPAAARPDLSVQGRVVLDTLKDVISIGRPAQATANGTGTLFVLHAGESVARRVPVRFGAASSDRIQVIAGLQPGDQAVLSDTLRWSGYERLQIR
ncbi:efflux RND transporter periplasmic adaptor subunit [Pinirhizobacter soli]|uniref:efflux RND transporter periplasmic adaptor subunit n=1 Tax=Pinirhizobacter soli TaxID=2786953 RepID=UPI00202A066E|nr:HlyD family efflux transporter periplasmic adaptor subunit [Pinirhizobacter soli]